MTLDIEPIMFYVNKFGQRTNCHNTTIAYRSCLEQVYGDISLNSDIANSIFDPKTLIGARSCRALVRSLSNSPCPTNRQRRTSRRHPEFANRCSSAMTEVIPESLLSLIAERMCDD